MNNCIIPTDLWKKWWNMFKNRKLIIFDMDGTLIDSVGIWNQVDLELIKSLGGSDEALSDIQSRRDDILRKYREYPQPYHEYCRVLKEIYGFSEQVDEIIKKRYETAGEYLRNVIDYKPGAAQFIKELKKRGYILVIASTTKRSNMDIYRKENSNIKDKAPLDMYFDRIYTREDASFIKPDPEIYVRTMEDFSVEPGQCLVFEDSLVGVEASKAAGIDTVVVYDSYSDEDREELNKLADYSFSGYDEAMKRLELE